MTKSLAVLINQYPNRWAQAVSNPALRRWFVNKMSKPDASMVERMLARLEIDQTVGQGNDDEGQREEDRRTQGEEALSGGDYAGLAPPDYSGRREVLDSALHAAGSRTRDGAWTAAHCGLETGARVSTFCA